MVTLLYTYAAKLSVVSIINVPLIRYLLESIFSTLYVPFIFHSLYVCLSAQDFESIGQAYLAYSCMFLPTNVEEHDDISPTIKAATIVSNTESFKNIPQRNTGKFEIKN